MRRYAIDLYDRRVGETITWQLFAEMAFKVGLEAIDFAPDSLRCIAALHRLHDDGYDPLTEFDTSYIDLCGQGTEPQGPAGAGALITRSYPPTWKGACSSMILLRTSINIDR